MVEPRRPAAMPPACGSVAEQGASRMAGTLHLPRSTACGPAKRVTMAQVRSMWCQYPWGRHESTEASGRPWLV
jgi:hypothetical protein